MFFTEKEKAIYVAPDGRRYDPLRVDRLLTAATGNRFDELVLYRNNARAETGDVSKQGRAEAAVLAARAEIELADAARKVFEFPSFAESGVGDAVVLETLYHYLGWMEGKGETAGTPQSTPVTPFESRQGLMTSGSH